MAQQHRLDGKKVAILVGEGFEEVEMTEPRKALDDAGATTHLISPESGKVRSWHFDKWGNEFDVDVPLNQANAEDYDALLVPGGVMSPDHLRTNEKAVSFVRSFFDAGKPIASICHGPWLLLEADIVRGIPITSWPSIKTDLRNAGAEWVDEEVVTHQGIVTSRNPDDLHAFNRKMIEEFAEGRHEARRRAA